MEAHLGRNLVDKGWTGDRIISRQLTTLTATT
jgi:hypothetical protein